MVETQQEPKSWGEAIKQYRRSNQLLSYDLPGLSKDFSCKDPAYSGTTSCHLESDPAANKLTEVDRKARHPTYGTEGVVHRTRYTQARREAAYNPITGRHLDRTVESGLCAKEKADMVMKANKGQDRALATETSFNVINFANKRQGLDPPAAEETGIIKTYIPDSRAPYNIVSNISHKDHHWAIPELRPTEESHDPKVRYVSKFVGRQEYNIVNNRYLEHHESRMAEEKEQARATATKAFWKTHSYDPIEVKAYDDDKEAQYQQSLQDMQRTQGMAQAENIRMNAPTTHLSEGNLYDPVTCQAKNEDAIKQLHRLEQGKVEATQARLERVGEYLAREDDHYEVKAARALNKAKWKRFEEDHSHGYDIVNNQAHFGRGAKPTHLPKARPDPTMWETINEEALKSIDAQTLSEPVAATPELGDSAVPPIRITPFHSESRASSIRSGSRRSSAMGSAKAGSSVTQREAASGRSAASGTVSGRVSASGRVRTGGFQHLSGSRAAD